MDRAGIFAAAALIVSISSHADVIGSAYSNAYTLGH